MTFFIYANSMADPIYCKCTKHLVEGEDPKDALSKFAATFKEKVNPIGLFAAGCFSSEEAYDSNEKPLAVWLYTENILTGIYEGVY